MADLQAVGLSCDLVSGAGTGTAAMEASTGLWNELQAGSYAFMDCDYNAIMMQSGALIGEMAEAAQQQQVAASAAAGVSAAGSSSSAAAAEMELGAGFQSSLFVLTEIMSLPGPGRAVCDAGLKASSVDSGLPVVAETAATRGLSYLSASDEHGRILISDEAAASAPPSLGDKLRLIPGHCDPTVNMYDWIVGVRGGVVEEVWRVAGRGMR